MTTSTPTKKFMRTILVMFALTGMMLCISGCWQSEKEKKAAYKENIIRVLDKDASLGSYTTAESICNAMAGIDTKDCPPDFNFAWHVHQVAWAEAVGFEKDYPAINIASFIAGNLDLNVINVLILITAEIRLRNITKHIETTYENVLQCAEKYGVDTTKYRK